MIIQNYYNNSWRIFIRSKFLLRNISSKLSSWLYLNPMNWSSTTFLEQKPIINRFNLRHKYNNYHKKIYDKRLFFPIFFLKNLFSIFRNKEKKYKQYTKNLELLLFNFSKYEEQNNFYLFCKKNNEKISAILYTNRYLLNILKKNSFQELTLYISTNTLILPFIFFFKKHTNTQYKVFIDLNIIDSNLSNTFFDIIKCQNSNLSYVIKLLKELNKKLIKNLKKALFYFKRNRSIRLYFSDLFFVLNEIERNLISHQTKYINLEFGYKYTLHSIKYIINYHLLSLNYNSRINLISYLVSLENTLIFSLTNLFKAASWYEREIWDLYGVFFQNHQDLRRILTDYGFESYPFRKDFPLNGYLEIKYNEIEKRVIYETIEFNQEFRYFTFLSNWDWQ